MPRPVQFSLYPSNFMRFALIFAHHLDVIQTVQHWAKTGIIFLLLSIPLPCLDFFFAALALVQYCVQAQRINAQINELDPGPSIEQQSAEIHIKVIYSSAENEQISQLIFLAFDLSCSEFII